MGERFYTIGELSDFLTGGDERHARLILWPSSADVWIEAQDRGELVPESTLLDLLALHPKRLRLHKKIREFLYVKRREREAAE